MNSGEGSRNKIDEVRERLLQEARQISAAEVQEKAAAAPPPRKSFFRRYRQQILLAVSILVIAGAGTAAYFVYRHYVPAAPPRMERGEGYDTADFENELRQKAEKKRAAKTEPKGTPLPSREELRSGALVDRDKDLDDVSIGAGRGLSKP